MRILLPTHSQLHGGGIATVVRGLLPALTEAAGEGDELIAVAPPHRPGDGAFKRIGGVRGALARLAYEQIDLPFAARKADSLHLCDARSPLATTRPFVLTVHDVSYLDNPEWFSRGAARYKATMLAAGLRRGPAAVVCDSEMTRERLLAHHPRIAGRVRVEVVPPGVEAPPSGVSPEPGDYFLTVATLEPRKNHLNLLAAFRRARREGLPLRWKVVGADGHLADTIRPALEAADGVEVLGKVSQERLEQLYAGASFVASPSLLEGFGYPPLEAMARGRPVIASAGGVYDETVADAAVRVPGLDVNGWAEALLRLTGDAELRTDLVTRGHQRVTEFPWSRSAQAIWQIHHESA